MAGEFVGIRERLGYRRNGAESKMRFTPFSFFASLANSFASFAVKLLTAKDATDSLGAPRTQQRLLTSAWQLRRIGVKCHFRKESSLVSSDWSMHALQVASFASRSVFKPLLPRTNRRRVCRQEHRGQRWDGQNESHQNAALDRQSNIARGIRGHRGT